MQAPVVGRTAWPERLHDGALQLDALMGGARSDVDVHVLAGGGCKTAAVQLSRLLQALQRASVHDAAVGGSDVAAFALTGLPYARAVGELLAHQNLAWSDLLHPHPALARICGLLASAHAGERAAAYRHALRWLLRAKATWLTASSVPAVLSRTAPIGPPSESSDPFPPWNPAEAESEPAELGWTAREWSSTLRWLIEVAAWRDPYERNLLHELERVVGGGGRMPAGYAQRVRDILWFAETHGLRPQAEAHGGEGI